jgi:hypothetical protein
VSAYSDLALTLPNLEALWMLTEASGTTATDLGPNTLPGTYSASKVQGVENILGAGTGMLASSGLRVTIPALAGSALAPLGAISIAAWITPLSYLTVGSSHVAGRDNHFKLMCQANHSVGLVGYNGAVRDVRLPQWTADGQTLFVVVTFDGTLMSTFVNGELGHERMRPGTLASVGDSFVIGAASTPMQGTISGVGMWSRALNLGEIGRLWRAGTKVTPVTQGVSRDFIYDANPLVAGSTEVLPCPIEGGRRRSREPKITIGSIDYHPGCVAAKAKNQTLVDVINTTPAEDYEGTIIRTIHEMLQVQMFRITGLTKPYYYDGAVIKPDTTGLSKGYDIYGPYALTAALLAWQQDFPPEHWMVDFAITQTDRVWRTQDSLGNLVDPTGGAGGADFVMGQLCEAAIYLAPYVGEHRWLSRLNRLGNYFLTQPAGHPESQYYVNGNREAFELWGYYMLYLATGAQQWLDQYELQLVFLTDPPPNSGTTGVTYGLTTTVVPTDTVAHSDGKAYLIEHGSGPNTIAPGYDPNYTSYQAQALARLYCYNKDIRILRLLNKLYNQIVDRANLTDVAVGDLPAWSLDGRGGSRQDNQSSFGIAVLPVLGWDHLGNQARVTDTQIAGAWNEAMRFFTVDRLGASDITRDVNVNLGTWLTALPTWRGVP